MADRDVNKEMDALKEELSRLRNDLRSLGGQGRRTAEAGTDAAREYASRTRASLQREVEDLIDRLRDTGESVRSEGRATVGSWRERMEERPLSAAVVALGLGFAVGWLSSRNR